MAPKPVYGKPEPRTPLWKTALLWTLVALGLIGITWMIAVNPREKTLNCNSSGNNSLIGFGTCATE